jgi:hypothetical protein
MNKRPECRTPAFVSESVEKVIGIENEAAQPRSRSDAIIDLLAGFIGTISFVMLQISACAFWTFVNAGKIPGIAPFDPFPYPLLSAITSRSGVDRGLCADEAEPDRHDCRSPRSSGPPGELADRAAGNPGYQNAQSPEYAFGGRTAQDTDSQELERRVAVEHLVEEVHSRLTGDPDVRGATGLEPTRR